MRSCALIFANVCSGKISPHYFARNSSSVPQHMKAWHIHRYGNADELKLETVSLPIIRRPSDILIEVKATSINPIDTRMIEGYGSVAINALRRTEHLLVEGSEFPLTLGRDFSGKIIDIGRGVKSRNFKIGDEVWGTVKASYRGSFAQYLTVPSSDLSFKPKSLSHVQASAFPYVASTTWAAISCLGNIEESKFRDKKVLILGGSGGVGSFAIQLFRAWGAEVTTTVSADFLDKALELGATNVVDYHDHDCIHQLNIYGRYDLIYDLVASQDLHTNLKLLKPNLCSRYVTIINPFLKNINKYGVPVGIVQSGVDLALAKLQGLKQGGLVSWGVFYPNAEALNVVRDLIEKKKMVPLIEKVFPFNELPLAMKKVAAGKNRGKTIIDFSA